MSGVGGTAAHFGPARLIAVLLVGVVVALAGLYWLQFRSDAAEPAGLELASVVQPCGTITASQWSASGRTGSAWVVATNATSCDTPRRIAGDIVGKDLVSIADIDGFHCTANNTVGGKILAGICYADDMRAAYFTWGADVQPYRDVGACPVCTGVPGQSVADIFKLSHVSGPPEKGGAAP